MSEPVRPYRYPVLGRPISPEQLVQEIEAMLRRANLVNDRGPRYTVRIGDRDLDAEHAGNPRRYAQVWLEGRVFELATATLWLPYCHRLGLIAHEVGHVLTPGGSEAAADQAAAYFLGVQIAYDHRWPGKGLQFAQNCMTSVGDAR